MELSEPKMYLRQTLTFNDLGPKITATLALLHLPIKSFRKIIIFTEWPHRVLLKLCLNICAVWPQIALNETFSCVYLFNPTQCALLVWLSTRWNKRLSYRCLDLCFHRNCASRCSARLKRGSQVICWATDFCHLSQLAWFPRILQTQRGWGPGQRSQLIPHCIALKHRGSAVLFNKAALGGSQPRSPCNFCTRPETFSGHTAPAAASGFRSRPAPSLHWLALALTDY